MLFLYLVFQFGSELLFGQHSILESFDATVADEEVILSWTIKKGASCFGISILRSDDSTRFYEIGEIPGICGSEEAQTSYSFVDQNPQKGAVNHYRLFLGNDNPSEILTVSVVRFDDHAILVFPNPADEWIQLKIKDGLVSTHPIHLLNQEGKVVYEEEARAETLDVWVGNLPSGWYTVIVRNTESGRVHRKKFLIMR